MTGKQCRLVQMPKNAASYQGLHWLFRGIVSALWRHNPQFSRIALIFVNNGQHKVPFVSEQKHICNKGRGIQLVPIGISTTCLYNLVSNRVFILELITSYWFFFFFFFFFWFQEMFFSSLGSRCTTGLLWEYFMPASQLTHSSHWG